MNKVTMYCTAVCPYCVAAERLLKTRGVESIEKIRIDLEPPRMHEMMEQIYIGDTHVGGYDDLSALDNAGGLMPLLSGT